jgi:hypothetical protein
MMNVLHLVMGYSVLHRYINTLDYYFIVIQQVPKRSMVPSDYRRIVLSISQGLGLVGRRLVSDKRRETRRACGCYRRPE